MIIQDEMEKEFKLLELNEIEETDFDKFVCNSSLIETHFANLKFKHFDITQNRETQQLQITITLEQFSNKFIVLCIITINFLRKRVDCKSYIAKSDGQLIQVKEKYLQRLLTKYFCRINNTLRFGCFCIENESGQIQFKLHSIMIQEHWTDLMCLNPQYINQSNNSLSNLLNMLHLTSHNSVGYHIYRLMHLINKLSYKVFPFLEAKLQDQYRKIHPQFDIQLQRINDIIENKCTMEISEHEINQFKQYFTYPKQSNPQAKIINKIVFLNPEQVEDSQIISDEEFSKVQKSQLAFSLVQSQGQSNLDSKETVKQEEPLKEPLKQVKQMQNMNNQDQNKIQTYLKKTIVIKKNQDVIVQQNEKQDVKKPKDIKHEKKILEILSQNLYDKNQKLIFNGYCPYIAQHYTTDTTQQEDMFKQHLFLEFYQHMSLNNFRKKFQTTQSLNTRLYILFQIAHSLRYLFQYGVIHMNLKPKNVLITKNYNSKLKGFGYAMYKQGEQIKIQRGQGGKPPFAAPESISDGQNNNQNTIDHQSDIFSFGILMYEFLFEQYPIDFNKSNLSNLQERYKAKSYKIRSNIDFIKTLGPKHLMKYLRNLAVKCLHPDPKLRPNIEWIIICIREGLFYLDKMY